MPVYLGGAPYYYNTFAHALALGATLSLLRHHHYYNGYGRYGNYHYGGAGFAAEEGGGGVGSGNGSGVGGQGAEEGEAAGAEDAEGKEPLAAGEAPFTAAGEAPFTASGKAPFTVVETVAVAAPQDRYDLSLTFSTPPLPPAAPPPGINPDAGQHDTVGGAAPRVGDTAGGGMAGGTAGGGAWPLFLVVHNASVFYAPPPAVSSAAAGRQLADTEGASAVGNDTEGGAAAGADTEGVEEELPLYISFAPVATDTAWGGGAGAETASTLRMMGQAGLVSGETKKKRKWTWRVKRWDGGCANTTIPPQPTLQGLALVLCLPKSLTPPHPITAAPHHTTHIELSHPTLPPTAALKWVHGVECSRSSRRRIKDGPRHLSS
jgi:hypothetical protein